MEEDTIDFIDADDYQERYNFRDFLFGIAKDCGKKIGSLIAQNDDNLLDKKHTLTRTDIITIMNGFLNGIAEGEQSYYVDKKYNRKRWDEKYGTKKK